jgi:septin family protein
MKSDYYDSVVSRLQKICGAEAMEEISKCWKNIDAEIEQEYQKYLSLEESIRKIEEEAANIR